MESSSNCAELVPKTEIDNDTSKRVQWTSENTSRLIEVFEKECRELWDTKNPLNKDKNARQAKFEYLAVTFRTNAEEISRKLHNLRTQFNNELRKIKRRAANGEPSASSSSSWEYFEPLLFLLREPLVDTTESMDAVNLALAEFQADEELEMEAATRARVFVPAPTLSPNLRKPLMKVAASAPNPLPPSANPMFWPDEPRIRPSNNLDECQVFVSVMNAAQRCVPEDWDHFHVLLEELLKRVPSLYRTRYRSTTHFHYDNFSCKATLSWSLTPEDASVTGETIVEIVVMNVCSACSQWCHMMQIFGDFVASELRTLRSLEARRRLKKIIQKAILQVLDEEDTSVFASRRYRMSSTSPDPLR